MSAAGVPRRATTMREPEDFGAAMAKLHAELAPKLFLDLEQSGAMPSTGVPAARARAAREWECFALYACVRGLVAALGFNRETGAAIDAFHQHAFAAWSTDRGDETIEERRALVAERYAEYGAIGQAGGASGASTVAARLGEAATRHMTGTNEPASELIEMVGALHEALVEGAAETLRRME